MSKKNQQPEDLNQESGMKNQEEEKKEETALPEEGSTIGEEKSEWQVKAEEYLNDLKRVQADFENYKKRQAAEVKEFSSHLAKSIVSDLIPVLDNLHAAAEHVPADLVESPWVKGITYIEKQFEDALKQYGVEPIVVKPGDAFNPVEHEAVDVQNQESGIKNQGEEKQVVSKVIQKGYKVGDKVIKPAKVIVSSVSAHNS